MDLNISHDQHFKIPSNSFKKIVHFPFVLYSCRKTFSFLPQIFQGVARRWMNRGEGGMGWWESSQELFIELHPKEKHFYFLLFCRTSPALFVTSSAQGYNPRHQSTLTGTDASSPIWIFSILITDDGNNWLY